MEIPSKKARKGSQMMHEFGHIRGETSPELCGIMFTEGGEKLQEGGHRDSARQFPGCWKREKGEKRRNENRGGKNLARGKVKRSEAELK